MSAWLIADDAANGNTRQSEARQNWNEAWKEIFLVIYKRQLFSGGNHNNVFVVYMFIHIFFLNISKKEKNRIEQKKNI